MKLALVLTLILSLLGSEPLRWSVTREIRTEIASRKKATDKSVKSILSKLPCDLRRAIERERIQVNGFLLNHRFSTVLIFGSRIY
jgi:hypothetical protein